MSSEASCQRRLRMRYKGSRIFEGPKGYTFIEVLVAMAIFSSMIMLATMALNQGLKQYKGLMEKGINFWDKAKYVWIDSSFSAITDYYVVTDGGNGRPIFTATRTDSYVSLSPSHRGPACCCLDREGEER